MASRTIAKSAQDGGMTASRSDVVKVFISGLPGNSDGVSVTVVFDDSNRVAVHRKGVATPQD